MADLRPWRVPVAVVLLAAVAVQLGVGIASLAGAVLNGAGTLTALVGLGVATGDVVEVVALAAVCWWCVIDDVRGAHALATVGFVLVAVQVLMALFASVGVHLRPGIDPVFAWGAFLVQLTWLVVPVLAAAVLLRAARTPVAGSSAPAGEPSALVAGAAATEPGGLDEPARGGDAAGTAAGRTAPVEEPTPVDQPYRDAAGWEPHEAAGAAWVRADEAAKGGAASDWGSDAGSGWRPADWPTPPLPPDDAWRPRS